MSPERREAFEVGERPSLEVRLASGALQVLAGEPGKLEVRVIARDPDVVNVEQAGDRVMVWLDDRRFGRWSSADVAIRVPPHTDVDVRGASTDVTIGTPVAALRASLASGGLRAGAVEGAASVRSASGDVEVGSVSGRLDATSASGDVRAERLEGQASLSTASGDVRIGTALGAVTARTASGDITVEHFGGDDLEVNTMSGDVRVTLPAGREIDLDLSSLSGDIGHDFVPTGNGGGHARVAVTTVSGDIRLRSRPA